MFIRRTNTRERNSGEAYVTYRLVAAARVGKAVKQRTLLNLGTHFDLPQTEWLALATRIDQLLNGQASLLAPMLSETVESLAPRYAAQLIARQAQQDASAATAVSQCRQAAQTPRCLGVLSIRRRASFVQFRRDHYPV